VTARVTSTGTVLSLVRDEQAPVLSPATRRAIALDHVQADTSGETRDVLLAAVIAAPEIEITLTQALALVVILGLSDGSMEAHVAAVSAAAHLLTRAGVSAGGVA
jgi:hypothetical protein